MSRNRLLLVSLSVVLLGAVVVFGELGCGTMLQREGDFNDVRGRVPQDLAINPNVGALPRSDREQMVLSALNVAEDEGPASVQPAAKTRAPQVWKRDRRRPSFARVYVGDGNSLQLVSLHVSVTVEGPRARTVVDHIFRNPHDRQLEGTFEYPLPTGASPSYFALFLGQTRDALPPRFVSRRGVPPLPDDTLALLTPRQIVKHVDARDWGTLQEARVVAKATALETYEDVVRTRIDPALLEYAGGNTFSGRVFPIPAKGYNRVILAYEELLPATNAGTVYRFGLPDCKLTELKFSLHADASAGAGRALRPTADAERAAPFRHKYTWKDRGPGGELVVAFTPPRPEAQALVGRHGESGSHYLYARVRPDLKVERAEPFAAHAVFLLDTSLSEHPDRFAVSMKLLREILASDPDLRRFNILTFDAAARWVEPKGWLENTPAGRQTAFARLDGILLEGATDLSAALAKLCRPGFEIAPGTPVNVFLLSDGQTTWGDTDTARMVARFEDRCPFPTRFHCYRTGLGADNAELFEALTRKGGGIFNCFGASDLKAVALAHRHQCFQVDAVRLVGGPAAHDVLVAGRKAALYPGGELIVAARLAGHRVRPMTLVMEGRFQGKKEVREIPLTPAASELAARAWAEAAVASLLAVNDSKLEPLVTAYCQEFNIGSRVASFLVLENEADYKRLDLEKERGKTVAGDLSSYLDGLWHNLGEPVGPREAFDRFLARIEPRVKVQEGADFKEFKKLVSLLTDADFELPPSADAPLPRKEQVPSAYRHARRKDPRKVGTYVAEARRRAGLGDDPGAVRALSSVVEQYPARADALRLVGYRLLDLRQAGAAATLFRQVENNRPFEAHSYRDLARSLAECGKYGLAAVHYEIVLAGTWHSRFGDALKTVAREEYVQMMRQAVRRKAVSGALVRHFGARRERLAADSSPSDLRVTISWNTDATDVDLWVFEPDGTKVFYSTPNSPSGGQLSQDQTQGYGPERYRIARAKAGTYKIMVHYFRANPNLLAGETHVQVVVTRHAGTPREVVERYNVTLQEANQAIEVARVKF